MANESINEPHDLVEVRFTQLEQQIRDINCNVNTLVVALNRKLWIFGKYGGLNAEVESEQGSKDWGETKNQSKKESIKD